MSFSMIGRYRVLDPLGQGAMGTVVRAFDPELGRVVAIKTLHAPGGVVGVDAAQERRFVVEARSVARLRHPGIVAVYDVGRGERGAYMVMECVQGLNLRQCLAQGVRLSVPGAVHLMAAVLAALEHAHAQQILHRDIKPENILVDAQGEVKLTDFGIAKMLDTQTTHATLMDGQLMGTPRYMSPEQLRGEPLDARCDVFACGVLLYELLAGRAPFEGAHVAEVIQHILNQEPEAPGAFNPAVPAALERVVAQALHKTAALRFASVALMREALVVALSEEEPLGSDRLDPDDLLTWVVPASRPVLTGLLSAVKAVDPLHCALSSDPPGTTPLRADLPLKAGQDITPSGLDALRTTQPLRRTAVPIWPAWTRGWRSRSAALVLVLAAGTVWLWGRPVPLPGGEQAQTVSPSSARVSPDEALAPGEQWVAPATDTVSLTMDRQMTAPVVTARERRPADGARGEAVPAPRAVAPPNAVESSPPPRETTVGASVAQSSDAAPAITAAPSVSVVPQRTSEPCTGLGFLQREQCLWRECFTDRHRRHPVCARFR